METRLITARTRASSAPPGSYLSYEEIRSALEKGSWPGDYCGYGESSSPQLWVRLAQLAQDYLEEKTGETWTVVDFTYPFPDNGPIPVPPTRDENDPLLDGATFAQVAAACQDVLGDYGELVLLSPDTPAMIEFQPAGEYRNWKAPHEVDPSEAQSIIFNSLGKWRFVYAPADALRTAKNKSDRLEFGGMRATGTYEPPLWTWTSPGEHSAPDEALARIVQGRLAIDAGQLIALSSFEEEDDNLVVHAHVVLPWGTVPESSREFCALLEELRERVWEQILKEHPGYEHRSLGLLVYVVDAEDITRAYDETATFEEMRLAALEDPRLLTDFSPTIQLVARPYPNSSSTNSASTPSFAAAAVSAQAKLGSSSANARERSPSSNPKM